MITWQKSSMKGSTDDPMITLKRFRKIRLTTTDDPTITFRFFRRSATDDPMITFGFFDERYRWSDDHIRFFWRTLPMIRWSHFGFYRWSDDHNLVFTDDPMIITYRWSDDHIYRWSDDHLCPLYRWSDDHKKLGSAKILPMIRWSKKKVPWKFHYDHRIIGKKGSIIWFQILPETETLLCRAYHTTYACGAKTGSLK